MSKLSTTVLLLDLSTAFRHFKDFLCLIAPLILFDCVETLGLQGIWTGFQVFISFAVFSLVLFSVYLSVSLSFILMSFLCQATPSISFSVSLFSVCICLFFCLFLSSAVWIFLMSTPWWSTGASLGKVPPSLLSHGYRPAHAMASLSFFLFPFPTTPPFLFSSSALVLFIPLPVLFCRDGSNSNRI